jgi:hypothetical protein
VSGLFLFISPFNVNSIGILNPKSAILNRKWRGGRRVEAQNGGMFAHCTHVGELAAGRAVTLLPSVIGDATPEPERRERGEILREIQTIAKTISAKNWRKQKAALLAMLAGESCEGLR